LNTQNWQRRLEIFYEMSRAINTSMSQKNVLDVMLNCLVTELGFKAASVRLLNEEENTLELKAFFGMSEAYIAKGAVELSKSGIDRTVLTGKVLAIRDVTREAGFQYSRAAEREGLASLLAVPLLTYGKVIGVLHLYSAAPHEFSEDEQSFIAGIVSLGAQAIRRTHCFEAFHRVVHLINCTLELNQVLRTLLQESIKELNVRAGSIRLLEPENELLHLVAACGLSDAYLKKGDVKLTASPIDRQVLQEARPITIVDIRQGQAFQYAEAAFREGIRSVLILPLRLKDAMIGVMRLYSGQVRRFSPEEINLADAVADLGAVAIENARLHQMVKDRLEALKEDADGWYRFLALG
jgi:GAF domain-containing protein